MIDEEVDPYTRFPYFNFATREVRHPHDIMRSGHDLPEIFMADSPFSLFVSQKVRNALDGVKGLEYLEARLKKVLDIPFPVVDDAKLIPTNGRRSMSTESYLKHAKHSEKLANQICRDYWQVLAVPPIDIQDRKPEYSNRITVTVDQWEGPKRDVSVSPCMVADYHLVYDKVLFLSQEVATAVAPFIDTRFIHLQYYDSK
jgi:hypothetical protein